MKKIILLSLLGVFSAGCKQEVEKDNDTIVNSKKIEDSIKKVREQEVINLNVDDSKTFDKVKEENNFSEKEKKHKERNEAIYSLPTLK